MNEILISGIWKDQQNKTNQKNGSKKSAKYDEKLSYLRQTKIVLPLIKLKLVLWWDKKIYINLIYVFESLRKIYNKHV